MMWASQPDWATAAAPPLRGTVVTILQPAGVFLRLPAAGRMLRRRSDLRRQRNCRRETDA
jgi:hypothetical protein